MTSIDFVIGYIAGEAYFSLTMNKTGEHRYPRVKFGIRVNDKDTELLERCQEVFEGVGVVKSLNTRNEVEWVVTAKDDIEYVRDKIEAYAPEIWQDSEKYRNFQVWSQILDIHVDGKTTAGQAVEMAELARDGLNTSNGTTEERWNEYISELEARA